MAKNVVGNIDNSGTDVCPKCDNPFVHYLMCPSCGYYQGTPV